MQIKYQVISRNPLEPETESVVSEHASYAAAVRAEARVRESLRNTRISTTISRSDFPFGVSVEICPREFEYRSDRKCNCGCSRD